MISKGNFESEKKHQPFPDGKLYIKVLVKFSDTVVRDALSWANINMAEQKLYEFQIKFIS